MVIYSRAADDADKKCSRCGKSYNTEKVLCPDCMADPNRLLASRRGHRKKDTDNVSLELLLHNSIKMVEKEKAMGKNKLEAVAPEPLPPVEEVAQAVVDIAAAIKKFNSSRLIQHGVVLLLHAQCKGKVKMSQIKLVLTEAAKMDKAWLKPLEKKEGK